MSIETVVGHDAPQVRVTDEEDTKQIVDLTFVPVGAVVEIAERGDGGGLISVGLDPQTRVVADGEHVVDDLEALVLGGVVNSGDVGDLGVLGGCVVLKEGEDGENTGRGNVDGELVLPDGEPGKHLDIVVSTMVIHILLDVLGQTRHQVVAVCVQALALCLVGVDRVDDGALERLGWVARGILRSVSAFGFCCQLQPMPTRMLGVSVFSPAISFARRAVVENARAAVERAAVANGRLTASRIAMVCVSREGKAARCSWVGRQWGGEGGCRRDVLQS